MKVLKIVLITLVLCSVGILTLSCASNSSSTPAAQNQVATVKLGNLVINVTGTGNLAFSDMVDLAFQMAGIVDEVNVQAGDSVRQGQVLATLDTSQRDETLVSLESKVLQAQISLKNADLALDKAEDETVTTITGDIIYATNYDDEEIAILKLQDQMAQANLADAQKALADAQNASPEVTAPFDGFITTVNVSAGDAGVSGNGVPKGTVACQIVDPNKFQADILVSELDISQVKLGGDATVGIDAMPGISLPAKVTYISPTATIQSGVVNYKVTVEVTSLEPVRSSQSGQGGTTRPASGAQGQTPAPQTIQLRQGLSATVNILIQEKDNVLLVPSRAITRQQGGTYVNVLKTDGTTEQRLIKTGISDLQNTEVTDGLTEGEKVVIPQTTTTTSTTTTRPGGGIRIPGLGG
jgi:RND family efflux transporter MFP subunit